MLLCCNVDGRHFEHLKASGYDGKVSEHTECPCWPLPTAKRTCNWHVSVRTESLCNGRRRPGLIDNIFFYIIWMAVFYVCHLPEEGNGTKMHFVKKKATFFRNSLVTFYWLIDFNSKILRMLVKLCADDGFTSLLKPLNWNRIVPRHVYN